MNTSLSLTKIGARGRMTPLIEFKLAMLWFVFWSMCVGTTESDQAKNMGKCVVCQWRAGSKWHGWSVRQGRGEGDCHSRLLHEIQNLLHELWKWSHNLNYRIILFREIEKPHLRLWMILIVVSWDTSCLGRHSLGLSLLRNLFSFVGPQGSRHSQGRIFPHPGHSFTIRQLRPHSCHLFLTEVAPVVKPAIGIAVICKEKALSSLIATSTRFHKSWF